MKPEERNRADRLCFEALTRNGSSSEHSFFNSESLRVNSISMNSTMAVLSVAPWAFVIAGSIRVERTRTAHHWTMREQTVQVLSMFSNLVAQTTYLPTEDITEKRKFNTFWGCVPTIII